MRFKTLLILALLINLQAYCQEKSPIEEVTDFLKNKVWVHNMTCYGDSCLKNKHYDSYYYWDGKVNDYVRDSILFYSFELSSIDLYTDSSTGNKKTHISTSQPLIVVLSKDELEIPTYNCLYKSVGFSGFVELKKNKNEFVLKGLFNDDETIVTLQYKKTTPPPRIKEIIQFSPEKK